MSLSDKFYEGLSAPLPVTGAQMPIDLVPYGGGPLDALEQHKLKYKQLDYLQRLSDRTSKKLLKQLAKAEKYTQEEEDNMDKLSFIGNNPISRRAYYMNKIANPAPAPVAGAVAQESLDPQRRPYVDYNFRDPADNVSMPTETEVPYPESATTAPSQPPPPEQMSSPPPAPSMSAEEPLNKGDIEAINRRNRELGLPGVYGESVESLRRYDPAPSSYVGPFRRALSDSGRTLDTIDRFSRRFRQTIPPKQEPKVPTEPVDDRSMYDKFKDNLYHYGTRAARGLSTGAQMGASYLYDRAQENKLLNPDSYLGGALDFYGYRGSLADQMARVNASLAHSYGRDSQDPNARLYSDRLRRIDVDPRAAGMQIREDLLNRDRFKDQVLDDQMARYQGRNFSPEQLAELRSSASRVFDNYYGVKGNQAGTPLIREDLDGTSLRQGIVDLGDILRTGFRRAGDLTMASPTVNPKRATIRASELQEIMEKDPEAKAEIERVYGEAAAKLDMSLADYAAQRLASDFSLETPETTDLESGEQLQSQDRLDRYQSSRDLVTSLVDRIPEGEKINFIQQINPQAINMANELSSLVDTNPDEALARINNMEPSQARYLLDFLQTVSPYLGGDSTYVRSRIDPASFEVRADRDDILPSLGGVDLVNPALQAVGAGGDLGQMAGNARKEVYGFNSMHDLPSSEGRYYLVDDGNLINTYYNPTTGDVVRKLFTDMGNLSANSSYNTNEALPEQYIDAYIKQFGQRPTYTGRK